MLADLTKISLKNEVLSFLNLPLLFDLFVEKNNRIECNCLTEQLISKSTFIL